MTLMIEPKIFPSYLNFKISNEARSEANCALLQNCLDQQWADTWCMSFNTSKCKVLHVGRDNIRYHMNGSILEETEREGYLSNYFK